MEKIIITKKSELRLLLASDPKSQFKFEFPTFTSTQNDYWYKAVSKYYKPCGCETGSIFLMVAFVLSLSYHSFNLIYLSKSLSWAIVLYTLFFILIAALLGKLFGIRLAKIRLKNIINELSVSLNSPKMMPKE